MSSNALPIGRREVFQLGALAAGGLAMSSWLRRTIPNSREVEDAKIVSAALDGEASPSSGPSAASVHLAVFTDYRCSACRRAFPAMEAAIRADRDVRVIHKDWPIFGPLSERAARVALATREQAIYPAVHHMLMTDGRSINDNVLQDIVTQAGGDWAQVVIDLATYGQKIDAQLQANARQAFALGLAGTPGYLAGSILVAGAIDKTEFGRLFARAREVASEHKRG